MDVLTIGKDPTCDYVVVSEYASRVHAIVRTDPDGRPWLMDAGSTNGTQVRKPGIMGAVKVVGPYPLADGDVIIVGRVEIQWPIRREPIRVVAEVG
jgi:pSer/pThr/pTyr-binding forkhead associated (FHA) protein